MKIFALESSAKSASAALIDDGRLLGEFYIHTKLTHSETLMPMADALLQNTRIPLEQVDVFAVSAGPGSFTGIRIGVAAVKGLAMAAGKPCAAVSTLEAIGENYRGQEALVCAVMDARRSQVYNACFRGTGEGLERLTPDRAIGLPELAAELKNRENPQILVGDGALLCYTTFKEQGLDVHLAPPHLRYQSAWGVARAALEQARTGALTDAQGLVPVYHRLSQAERERLERLRAEEAAEKTR